MNVSFHVLAETWQLMRFRWFRAPSLSFILPSQRCWSYASHFLSILTFAGSILDNNPLATIPASAFNNFPLLTTLSVTDAWVSLVIDLNCSSLANTGISSLNPTMFNTLSSIQTLNLQVNRFTSVYPGLLGNLTTLTALDLNSNLITSVDSTSFIAYSNLQALFGSNVFCFLIVFTMTAFSVT